MRSSREGQYLLSGGWEVEIRMAGLQWLMKAATRGGEMRVLVVSEVSSD
jgi:hypothetical protein